MKRLLLALIAPLALVALPEGEKVVSGNVAISRPDSQTVLITASDKSIINYKSFDIAKNETAQFVQPKPTSVVLNRVVGGNPSKILGALRSNGKVFLVNPNGIYFGPNCEVSTGALIASTLDIEDKDFKQGKYHFHLSEAAKKSQIVNMGTLSASAEGQVVLLAPHIHNEGVISAQAGRISILSAETVTLDFTGDGLMTFAVDGELESAIIEHLGKISAPQGEVYLNLKTADHLIKNVVNLKGLVDGNKIVKENGVIRLVNQSYIDASTVTIESHNIEVSGDVLARETFEVSAEDTVRMRSGMEMGELRITGKKVAISSPIDCLRLKLSATEGFQLGSDIRTHNSPLVFDGPVFLTAPDVTLSTGSIGADISFLKTLDCDPRYNNANLTLSAGSGNIRFDGAVGSTSPLNVLTIASCGNLSGEAIRASSLIQNIGTGAASFNGPLELDGEKGLVLNCHVASLNSDVTTRMGSVTIMNTGPLKISGNSMLKIKGVFSQKGPGEVIIGGNIDTGGSMTFTGPILLIDNVTLNAGEGKGEIVFNSNVEGPGGLSISSGNLFFASDVGRLSPLASVKALSSGTILLNNIGGSKPGVTGDISLVAKDAIHFTGNLIYANSQKYLANKQFNMTGGKQTSFIASSSNTPITFEKGDIYLAEGTSLSITTMNGPISVDTVKTPYLHNLIFDAGEGNVKVAAMGNGQDIDLLSIIGGTITLGGPLKAQRVMLGPKSDLKVSGDISTTKGNLIFTGPVSINNSRLEFSAGGDILFAGPLDGTGDLVLRAHEGIVRFDGPIGSEKPFSSLNVFAQGIDQNSSVKITGPILYSGKTNLGGKISTTHNSILFNGPVIRDNIDNVIITSGSGAGDVIFAETLDADVPSREITIFSGHGSVHFKGAIGARGSLHKVSINGESIHLKDIILKSKPGSPSTLHISANEDVHLQGKIYHVGAQNWTAGGKFIIEHGDTARFISDGPEPEKRHIDFAQAGIELKKGTHFIAQTQGGLLSLYSVTSTNLENVSIDTGTGRAVLGSFENIGELNVKGYEIRLGPEIHAANIQLEAEDSILNRFLEPQPIYSSGDVFLKAKTGAVGTLGSPIWIKSMGKAYVGAKTVANLVGFSSDGLLHTTPSNRPITMIFNDFEYIDFSVQEEAFLLEEEQALTITPDLFTGITNDYVSPSAIQPKKALLYWQAK